MANKYLALQKDVFDINKVTVVGSPTITSDGVASGFSSANYIDIPADIFPEQINSIVIEGEVTTENLSTNQAIFGCKQNNSTATTPPAVLDVRLSLTGGQIVYSSGIGTQVAPTFSKTMKNNTSYKYKVEIIGTSIKFYLDGEAVFAANNFVYVKPSNFHIGVNRMLGDIFLGSINLPSTKIYADNQLIYSPTKPTHLLERRKEGYDPSKFTVVGTPTITEDGVASGFGNGNFIKISIPAKLSEADSWKIIFKNNTLYNDGYLFGGNLLNTLAYFKGAFWISSNGTSWDVASSVGTRTNIPANSLIQLEFTGSKYISKYSTDNGFNWNITGELDSNVKITDKLDTLYAGVIIGGNPANCSINLPSISTTVDGKEVFTGAKEQFYMLNGI